MRDRAHADLARSLASAGTVVAWSAREHARNASQRDRCEPVVGCGRYLRPMHVGTVFSQADSGTDADAIRRWAIAADQAGLHHMMAYDHVLGAPVERVGVDACKPFPTPPYTDREHLPRGVHVVRPSGGRDHDARVRVERARACRSARRRSSPSRWRRSTACRAGDSMSPSASAGTSPSTKAMGGRLRRPNAMDRGTGRGAQAAALAAARHLLRSVPHARPGRYQPAPRPPDPDLDGIGRSRPGARSGSPASPTGGCHCWRSGSTSTRSAIACVRLRQICEEQGRDPATMPVWGRCYLDGTDSWKVKAEQAAELGFSHFSVGFDRFAHPPTSHEAHLDAVLAVIDEVRSIVG